MSVLNEMIARGWGNIPQIKIPDNWRDYENYSEYLKNHKPISVSLVHYAVKPIELAIEPEDEIDFVSTYSDLQRLDQMIVEDQKSEKALINKYFNEDWIITKSQCD